MNKTYSFEEFLKWMMKQPKNRVVDMGSGMVNSPCNCVLSQFLRGKGYRKGIVYVEGIYGHDTSPYVQCDAKVELPVTNIFSLFGNSERLKTFGDLQKSLQPKYKKLLDKK